MHKYHDECKDKAGKTPGAQSARGSGTRGTTAKAEKEAELVVAQIRSALMKAALGLFIIDQFDGFCVMAGIPTVCENLKAVLVQHDGFRKKCLAGTGGGSIFGLVASVAFIALPIAAHHGLIPSRRIGMILVNLPFALLKLASQVKDSEENLTKFMQDKMDAARAEKQRKQEEAPQTDDGAFVVTDVGPSYAS
jgi:hypothetical protein